MRLLTRTSASRGLVPPSRDPPIDVSQRGVVEDSRRGVTHFLHGQADSAGLLVNTFRTWHVGHLADARDSGQRTIKDANDLPEGNVVWSSAEEIAATLAFLAFHDATSFQLKQDRLEKFLGRPIATGKIRNQHWASARLLGKKQ
jgi:hypothetical protein